MSEEQLQAFYEREDLAANNDDWRQSHEQLLRGLESGRIRAAERGTDGNWQAVMWVKRAILEGFKNSDVVRQGPIGQPPFFDKESYPARSFEQSDSVRVVPGGTSVRRGAYVSSGVVIMPPAYINVGAYVDSGTMVDSHALVGVFEGFVVRERAVLATGVTLTAATIVYDLVHGCERRGEVPAGAVVVPGSRPASGEFAKERGLQVSAPMIVKYRDERTDASTALEAALR